MTYRRLFFALLLLVTSGRTVSAQDIETDKNLEQRVTDFLRKQSSADFLSATRYVPVLRFRGLGTWASPQSAVLIDGIPFDGFPLNLRSPDYLAIDLLSIDSLSTIARPLLMSSGRIAGGGIDIIRAPLPDSLVIATRLYAGSETGDPVLQKYTRDNLELFNKNKIGFSGSTSVGNRAGRIGYRITGGVFGYFSTGYTGRDAIILSYIDRRMYARQNRNYLATVELDYSGDEGKNVSFYAGIDGIVGWEQMPFLSTFAFFEGHTNTLRVRLSDFLPDLDLVMHRDETLMTMRKQLGTEAGEYFSATYVFNPVWTEGLSEHTSLTAYSELALHAVTGSSGVPAPQFFDRDVQKTSWALGAALDHQDAELHLSGNLRIDRSILHTTQFSGLAQASFQPSAGAGVQVTVSSVVLEPGLLELYGRFTTIRQRPALARTDTFQIRGNPALQTGRVHSLDLACTFQSGGMSLSATAFYEILEQPIDRLIESIIRTSFPGDIVYSGIYVNTGRRTHFGIESFFGFSPSHGLDLNGTYVFTSNDDPTVPRHRFHSRMTASLASSTTLHVSVHGQAKTFWREFLVLPSNDDKAGEGIDGIVPSFWSLDASLKHHIGTLWFGQDISVRLELQNLFNHRVQYIPIGISHDTAVIGYIDLKL